MGDQSSTGNSKVNSDMIDSKSSHNVDKVTNPESNLSREELAGMKSLKQRISSGEIIIADTDKSKRFCAMTPEQYASAGEVHTNKDIEITANKVKRVQNFVNDHVWWLKESTQVGSNWQHEDRMAKNLSDKGEQVCQITLLIKDHKSWTEDSGKPVPSRPVISGNSGLNCHLSEMISMIIDPLAYEHNGNEVDSTDDMLDKLKVLTLLRLIELLWLV